METTLPRRNLIMNQLYSDDRRSEIWLIFGFHFNKRVEKERCLIDKALKKGRSRRQTIFCGVKYRLRTFVLVSAFVSYHRLLWLLVMGMSSRGWRVLCRITSAEEDWIAQTLPLLFLRTRNGVSFSSQTRKFGHYVWDWGMKGWWVIYDDRYFPVLWETWDWRVILPSGFGWLFEEILQSLFNAITLDLTIIHFV